MEKTIWEITKDISHAYFKKHAPEQIEALEEYLTLVDMETEEKASVPAGAYKFGPEDLINTLIIPLVVGIITNYLYDLMKEKINSSKNTKINSNALMSFRSNREKIELDLIKRTKKKKVVIDVLDYIDEYLNNSEK